MIGVKEYESGLKVIVNEMSGMSSVSVGILVGAGSCHESESENGISHFIEHTTFKGSEKMNAFEFSSAFDEIGAQQNAFTSKELTCYYVKSTTDKLERAFELLSDMFLNSVYSDDELEREKGVVTEEINMSLDTPEDVCFDNLAEAYFGKRGLGRTILGPAENVAAFTRKDILAYRKKYYNADNTVISFAGRIKPETAYYLAEKYFEPYISREKSAYKYEEVNEIFGVTVKKNKDIEQTHLGFAFSGEKFDAENSDMLSVTNALLGAGMSSRLFQRVREELGLCYTIYSYPSGYKNQGTVAIYAGVNPRSAGKAAEAVFDVLANLKRGGVTERECEKAKAQFLSSFEFGKESTSSQMILYGKYLLFTGKKFDEDKKAESVKNIGAKDINEYLRLLDFDKFSCSVYGKDATKVGV